MAALNQSGDQPLRLYENNPRLAAVLNAISTGKFSPDEDAALTLFGQPAAAFLKRSTIVDSAGVGVNLGYSGTFIDFVETNTFTRVAKCKVSYPRGPSGACPATVPCP